MEFPQAGSGPNRKQIIDALRNTAQSASNMVAENLSVPVDAIAWALRKAGVPVEKPMFGSDWMKEKGVTPTVPEGAAKVIGDTIGMISPMGLTKQGAKAMIDAGSKLKGLPVGLSIKDVSGVYPQAEALALAQQRAALPVEQGGLGLAAGNTPAERAAAMGFDTDLLHGTAKDFNKFDMGMAGTNTRQAGDELGVFATAKPFLADSYAEIASKGGWANRTQPGGATVYPLKANLQNPKRFDTASGFYREADPRAAQQGLGKWRTELEGEGFDSVIVRPDMEEVVAFNPDQLRSRFAAFDPFRKTAATAAAMGVAAPDLLAQERNK